MSIQNPLTFLELCQRLQLECGTSGNLMSTTVGASGEALRLVTWVSSACLEIQEQHKDYEFLRASKTFVSDTTKDFYTVANIGITAGTFGAWARNSFRNYLTSAGINGEIYMPYIPYEQWRDQYFIGAIRATRSQPIVMSINPQKSIVLGPIAATGYTIVGDYYISQQALVSDSDTLSSVIVTAGGNLLQSGMPHVFSLGIIGYAMMSYGSFENAAEVYNRGEAWYNKLIRRLAEDQLTEVTTCGALA